MGLAQIAVQEPGAFECKAEGNEPENVVIKRPDGSIATDYDVARP